MFIHYGSTIFPFLFYFFYFLAFGIFDVGSILMEAKIILIFVKAFSLKLIKELEFVIENPVRRKNRGHLRFWLFCLWRPQVISRFQDERSVTNHNLAQTLLHEANDRLFGRFFISNSLDAWFFFFNCFLIFHFIFKFNARHTYYFLILKKRNNSWCCTTYRLDLITAFTLTS